MKYKIEASFHHLGYECMVVGYELGHRAGYVAVPPSHPCYRKSMDELASIDVHGQVTYTGGNPEVDDDLWWIGFDTNHFSDAKDLDLVNELCEDEKMIEMVKQLEGRAKEHKDTLHEMFGFSYEVVYPTLTTDYCMEECKSMAEQLKAIEGKEVKG